MLKPFLLLTAAILLVIAIPPSPILAATHAPALGSTNPIKPTAGSRERAKKIYAIDCAMCHGDNGNGKTDLATSMQLTLLDYTDPKSLAGKSDQELFDLIRNGKGQMPPEDPARARDDEIWNLVIYIRGMSKGQPAAPPVPAPPSN